MKRLLMLSAVTRINRHAAMAGIDDIVVACGGWIEGHTLFSNIAATFRFVLPTSGLAGFGARVDALGVHLDAASTEALAARSPAAGEAGEAEVAGALAVTFVHDEPDLRREIPAIPG
ncbi:MAG: hypothetical protein Q8S27_16520 [Hoeflea sp.]|uniref:hypothetical protein n=1 Tax=Parvibaculum sp. TaxID=2024848 RepID=UPI00272F8964|nr:hypothetical protein [Parvibaculum sp.]MDP2149377.1 hypothetical protein [Parvibaculum sp.]MDP3526183.1 hypothetical protein [Hoeflea sp.]